MATTVDPLSEVFAALSHPTRRDMLDRLAVEPLSVGELARPYDVSGPSISQHLNVLERCGLIERRVNRQWRTCTISEHGLDRAAEWIGRHRVEWNERFDLLDERLTVRRKGEQ